MRSTFLRLVTGATGAVLTVGLAVAAPALAAPTPAAHKSTTSTSIAPVRVTAAKKVTLVATISPGKAPGAVAFRSGSTVLTGCGKAPVRSGRATCSVTLPAGKRTVSARYSGGSGYLPSTGLRIFTVAKTAVKATTFVGGVLPCTTGSGALVAVDFSHWAGPAVRGCDPNPSTGTNMLKTADFTTAGTQHNGPQFICRIGSPAFAKGAQYPTQSEQKCVTTPPASAYWSFWTALKGKNTWTYSTVGAYSDQPKAGEVEAWTFGGTDGAGTKGKPAFTPDQVRAGLPANTTQFRTAGRSRTAIAATARPDVDTAAGYLVNQLVDGNHYEPFGPGFADVGLTIDGGLALAATGTDDATLGAITDYVQAHVSDFTFLGENSEYADGGSIGKVALLAEVTGRDPRAFGGFNLIHEIDSRVCAGVDVAKGCAGAGNYENASSVFKQSLGLIAQLRASDLANAKPAATYLESIQRSSGGFPSTIPPTGNDSDTDSTGMAAMALALVPGATARDDLARALAWLASQQNSSGGFPGASGVSVNSAAVVIQALRLDAQTYAAQITKAESFLASEQNTDGGFNVAVGSESYGSDVRASAQALGGAIGTPFGSLLDDLQAKATRTDGANYLVSQLVDGDHYASTYDGVTYPDQGGTADALFALLSTGGHADTVAAINKYLTVQVDDYADPTGAFGGPFSGSLAKLALVAESTGGDPHSYGGVDLLKLLKSKVCTAAIVGDNSPCTAKGDVYDAFSTVSQTLAVLALQASPVSGDHLTTDSPIVVRLHQLQCADGGFSSTLLAPGAKCTSDVDTTGYAIQALAAVQGTDTWLGAAQSYLEKSQRPSGLFPGAAGDNSNSTALAAQALQSLVGALTSPTADPPEPKTITPIAAWQSALTGLRTLAVTGGGFGITSNTAADLRSSTQAVAAAAQVSLLQLSGATVLSLPRVGTASTPAGGGSSAPTTGTSSPPRTPNGSGTTVAGSSPNGGAVNGGTANGGTANTGVNTSAQLAWALALMLLGFALAYAGRRRVAVVLGRHRAMSGPRHR